jgi:hypothetical protein
MVTCTRKGCGQQFDEFNNPEGSCSFHSGGPVCHVLDISKDADCLQGIP